MIQAFLNYADIFARDFRFTINGGSFSTKLGGTISCLLSLTFLVLCWIFGNDLYYKQSPKVIKGSDLLKSPPLSAPSISNNNRGTFAAFVIRDEFYEYFNDVRYIEYLYCLREYVYKDSYTNLIESNCELKRAKKCSKNAIDTAMLQNNDLDYYYCFDFPNNQSLGSFVKDGLTHETEFHGFVKLCDQTTMDRYNITCATDEQMKEYFNQDKLKIYADVLYQDDLFYPKDSTKLFKETYLNQKHGLELPMSEKTAVYIDLEYKLSKLSVDSNPIYENFEEKSIIEFQGVSVYQEPPILSISKYFLKVKIRLGRSTNEYSISYIKVPDIIANVGGFLSIFTYFVEIFMNFYVENCLSSFLIRKLYDINIVEVEANNATIKSNIFKEINPGIIELESYPHNRLNELDRNLNQVIINDNSQREMLFSLNDTRPKIFKDLKKLANKIETSKVKIGCWERLTLIQGCNKKTSNNYLTSLITILEEKLSKKQEIFNLWKYTDNIKFINKLLLNENQIFMLNNQGSQSLTYTKDFLESLKENVVGDLEMKKRLNFKAYLQTRERYNILTDVDKYLRQTIDDNLRSSIN